MKTQQEIDELTIEDLGAEIDVTKLDLKATLDSLKEKQEYLRVLITTLLAK